RPVAAPPATVRRPTIRTPAPGVAAATAVAPVAGCARPSRAARRRRPGTARPRATRRPPGRRPRVGAAAAVVAAAAAPAPRRRLRLRTDRRLCAPGSAQVEQGPGRLDRVGEHAADVLEER